MDGTHIACLFDMLAYNCTCLLVKCHIKQVPVIMSSAKFRVGSRHREVAQEVGKTCTICKEAEMENPMSLQCGHYFCHDCIISQWLSEFNHQCPNCREPAKTMRASAGNTAVVPETNRSHLFTIFHHRHEHKHTHCPHTVYYLAVYIRIYLLRRPNLYQNRS